MSDGHVLLHVVESMRPLDADATVGQRIRYWREKRCLTQVHLCALAGLNRYSMIHYENDEVDIEIDDLKKIASALNIKADELFDDYYRFLDYPYSVRIREIRLALNLNQHDFGKMFGVGKRAVGCWERGVTRVQRKTWKCIASTLIEAK